MNKQLLEYSRKVYQNSIDKYNLAVNDYHACLKVYLKYVYDTNDTSEVLEKRLDIALKLVIKRYCNMRLCEEYYLNTKRGF